MERLCPLKGDYCRPECAWWQVDKCILVTLASAVGATANQLDDIRKALDSIADCMPS